MFFEEPTAKEHLSRIVQRVSRNPTWHDDLMQEAVIHLWRIETENPGHTLSWYLQSCLFHLMNRLAAGRSTDSTKREHQRDLFTFDGDEFSPEGVGEGPVCSEVIGREIILVLKGALAPLDQVILSHLADGFACREIARKLGISHPAVIKHRKRIAALAIRLGIAPPDRNGNENGNANNNSVKSNTLNGSARLKRLRAVAPGSAAGKRPQPQGAGRRRRRNLPTRRILPNRLARVQAEK
jgi:DNA-directed RNA polymerase specialized sigma24 family protein